MKVVSIQDPELHLVTMEGKVVDPREQRLACVRVATGIGGNISVLLTYDGWGDDAGRFASASDDVL